VTRLIDRMLARVDAGYNEYMYSGTYQVSAYDTSGRGREAAAAGLVRNARDAYEANGIVFACDLVRMSLFSEARFQFQSAVDNHLFGNTDLGILEHPWPNATQGELLARMSQDDTTAGNSYPRKVIPADESDPLIVQMRPECVSIVSTEARDTAGRLFKQPAGYIEDVRPLGIEREPQFYSTAEVAHYSPVPDGKASFRGMSWLTPVLREIGADVAMTRYKTAHLSNGAMPGIVIKYSRKLSDVTVDTLAKRLTGKHAGPENAGKIWVLDEGADMTVAGSTLEQLQFDLITKAGERRICAAAGPGLLEILGFEPGDYQAAVRKLADLWARPRWRQACAALEHLVPTSADIGPVRLWFDVSGIAALREGELQRAQSYLVKTQGLAASVAAGYTRESAIKAADTGDLTQLIPDPNAPPAGISGRETATEKLSGGPLDGRPPQAGVPQDLPGVVKPNLPNARPGQFLPMPALPNGARGGR
jgi:phage portal protein BeeE